MHVHPPTSVGDAAARSICRPPLANGDAATGRTSFRFPAFATGVVTTPPDRREHTPVAHRRYVPQLTGVALPQCQSGHLVQRGAAAVGYFRTEMRVTVIYRYFNDGITSLDRERRFVSDGDYGLIN
jgi:hypothetical protein